ncbi:MAG: DUF4190 domain-containing protein [Archangium sp.]|nr:DUF4190 domain-containing protein [Archangium sp.]
MITAFCPACGTPIEAEKGQHLVCPQCTTAFDAPTTVAVRTNTPLPALQQPFAPKALVTSSTPAKLNPWAVVSLALAFACCSPVALVVGLVALRQIELSHGQQSGVALARAGIALGGLQLILFIFAALRALGS